MAVTRALQHTWTYRNLADLDTSIHEFVVDLYRLHRARPAPGDPVDQPESKFCFSCVTDNSATSDYHALPA